MLPSSANSSQARQFGGPDRMLSIACFRRARLVICILLMYYTGFSESLPDRLDAHFSKNVTSTKSFDRIELVYYECCLSKIDAMAREKQLKTGFGRGYLKKRLNNFLENQRG